MKNFNSFFNQLTAIGKRLAMVLTLLLTISIGQAWGADYELVTSAPSDWSGEYLIVAGTSALSGGTSSWGTTTTVTVSNNKISTTENISVTISKGGTSGTYYIYMNSNSKYLKEVTSNTFATASTTSTDTEWKITLSNGNAQIACASATTRYLRLNGTSGYRCYTTSTGTLPKLYKKAASYTITAKSNNNTYGTVSLSGTTITARPETGYRVSTTTPYTISPSNSAKVTQNGNTFTVTPSANTTITINFEALPKYIVTLKDDNSTLTQSTAGATITLPSRDGCDGYEFVGWTKSWSVAQTTWTTTAPTIIPAGSYTPTANESLYPVYTKTEGGGTSYQFQKVTALSQIKAGGTFIITNGSYYLPNAQASSSGPVKANMVAVTNGVVTGAVTDAMKWTFSAADANGKITIKSAANSNYYLYTTNSNGGLRVNNTSDTWTFEEYTVSNILGFAMKSTSNSRYCAVYTDGSDWRSYTTKNAANYETNSGRLDLYKYTEISSNTTYYISVPNCCTKLAEVTDLEFSSITSNSITVGVPNTYAGKDNASGYTFNCYSASTGGSLVATADENGTSHTFNGLNKNTTYYFTIIAKGEGNYCNSAETSSRESSKTLAQYTVTLNLDGGTGTFTGWTANGDNYTMTVDAGTDITLPEPSKIDYDFTGWHDETQIVTSPYTPTKDVTLTAQWTSNKTATSLSWSAASYSATIDADNTFPVLTKSPADLTGVTYSSSNTSVATIDENTGDITLVAAGTTTITATFTENATHTGATASYTLTVHPSNCRWVEVTDNTTLEDDDEVVIAMSKGNVVWSILNGKNTSSTAPTANDITANIQGKYLTTVDNEYKWVIEKDNANLTFYSYSDNANYLYCTNADNGVRVGTGTAKVFVVDGNYLKNIETTLPRYLGVSLNTDPDTWRCYTDTTSVIAGQTLKFYKRECLDASKVWVEGNLTNVTCSPQLPQQLAKDGSIELTFTAADGYELPNTVTVTNATKTWNQATGKLTISNPTDNVMVTVEAVKYYTVTWKPTGGNWSGDTNDKVVKYEAGDKIVAPATPTYDCHEFLGWTPAYQADMTMPAENLEFTATWNKLSYTITFKNYDGTVLQTSTVECGETPSYAGATPTREQTAQYTYTFKDWSPTIAPATKDQVYTAQFNQTTRSYTVIWYDGTGNAHKTQTANYNTTVALPTTNPDPCDDEYPHFIGWTADPITGSTTTQPALVENVKVTGDCDYYAVFAKGEGGSSDYKLVTSAPADWSGTYLIVNTDDKKAWKGSATSDNGAIDITITNNTITSNATTDNETFTIATMTGGYSIKGTSGKYISGTSGSNATNYKDAAQLNTISIDNNNNVTITSNTSVLRQNNSSASLFRYYKSSSYSSQHPIQLYKKGSGVNYTSFITTCCTSWTAPTLTYTTPLNAETSQTAQPQFGNGTTYGNPTYTSSKPSVLSVDEATGEVTAVSKGTATITVTWEGNETYCSISATSNTITVNGSYSVTFHSNGGTGTMEPQKADPSTQRIAKLNKNEFTKAGYVFVGWKDASSVAYTDEQENITLTKNITLFAQWAPIVTLNDAGNEETAHPTAVNGTITLPDGANACPPYEFVGWTSDATADWNEGIEEPTLVASPYNPTQPTTLYAVYKIQSKGNSNAFKLSYEVSGTTYYVGSINSDPYIKGFSNITADDAVTFYKEKIENNTEKYWVYFEKYDSYYDETTKEYLYLYNGNDINTTNSPSETQGWILITLSNGLVQFKDITYDKYFSFTDGGNLTDHSAGSQKSFNLLPAVSSTYYAIPDCDVEIKITFETGNGDFIANTPATNPLVVTPGETITLPTCDYPGDGIEFIGWLKNTPQEELSDIIAEVYYEGGEEYVVNDTRDVIFYAYYKVTPEEVEFTGQDDAELKIYHYNGVDNYYYANTFVGEHAELAGIERCFDATTWKFTNVGNMQYYIQDETGKYLGAFSDSKNDFSLSNTPKVWNFTLVNGLWKMVCEDSPSRALMYISTGNTFANAAISNEGNGAYSYVTLGICPDDGYTTNPVLSQGFSITNTAMVTSASGQKVKATSALTLETRNIELPCIFTISAPNITFYDNTGAEVTQLTASAASEQFELYFAYKPTAENTMEYPTITITDDELKTYTIKNRIYARSLPATFAIVTKVGNIWYALPSQGLNSTTPPAAYPVEVDDMADPTEVTAVPANADWSLRGVYEASRSDATKDRYVVNGDNLVFVNNALPAMVLNASSSEEENYLLTDAQYANYYQTNPGLYEWTPTTTDLEAYQLTNEQRGRTLSVNTATVFGVHAQNKAVEQVRFLPIQNRYTPAALQVVEWKENSVVIMYNGNPAQTASLSVNGGAAEETVLSSAQRDIAVYELAATGLAANPTQRLSITIGTEKVILPIPYIISGSKTDYDLLPGSSVSAKREAAKVSDLVILEEATLTAAGTNKNDPYKFRHVTIYGGGKLVIPENNSFGVASLTLRAGGITDAGDYDYVYPQFDLRGTFINSAAKINYDYITDYEHWYHLVLPFAGELGTIKYPTEFYGANVTADNKGSWQIKRYAGEIRATGNYNAWVDIETEGKTSTIAGQGYIFWGAPKKVSVNGGDSNRQKWGIHRITMPITAPNAMTAENDNKAISELSSYANVPNNSGKDNDQGWNLIGNPYMVNLTDMATTGLHACKLVEVIDPATGKWNGKWEWNNETNIRYLTIPSDHFDTYTAKTVAQTVPLVAGRAFFVQLEGEANGITFAAANRASLMPALLAENNDKPVDIETGIILSNETLQDEVNFWIKDGKTNDYEYNADYPKTPNNNHFNIYGVHTNGDLSWVAISPELAAESMPIGYQVPAAGTYTLSVSETYYSDDLQALYVTDHAMSPELTVDLMNAPYEFSVNQAETNNERFTISLILKSENQGPTTDLENIGVMRDKPMKFIYQDKMYIYNKGTIYDATGKQVTTINK